MGPQLLGCGNGDEFGLIESLVLLQWGRSFWAAEIARNRNGCGSRVYASMGPQLLGCGNAGEGSLDGTAGKLQWGRSFWAAEIMTP